MASGNEHHILIRQLHSTPTFFIRKPDPRQRGTAPPKEFKLPPVSSNFVSAPSRGAGSLHYTTTSEACFSPLNRVGFPEELLPFRSALLRSRDTQFTDSFVAGAYRDSRLGVAEMRAKRIERLRKQQATVEAAKLKVMSDLKRLEGQRKRQDTEERKRERWKKLNTTLNVAIVLQKMVRGRFVRRRIREARHGREKAKERAVKEFAASKIQKWALRCLARAYVALHQYDEDSNDSNDEEDEGEEETGSGADSSGAAASLGGDTFNEAKEGGGRVFSMDDKRVAAGEGGERRKADGNVGTGSGGGGGGGDGGIQDTQGVGHQKKLEMDATKESKGSALTALAAAASEAAPVSKEKVKGGLLLGSFDGGLGSFDRQRGQETAWAKRDRQRRETLLLLDRFDEIGVPEAALHSSSVAVQSLARRVAASTSVTKIRNALRLVRWFLGTFFKSCPLHLKLEAIYLGRPLLNPRVQGDASRRLGYPILISKRLNEWQKLRPGLHLSAHGGLARKSVVTARTLSYRKQQQQLGLEAAATATAAGRGGPAAVGSAVTRRPQLASKAFNDKTMSEYFRYSKQEAERLKDVEKWETNREASALMLQAAWRAMTARKRYRRRLTLAKEVKAAEATRLARAMMLRIPTEEPDRTATQAWLVEDEKGVDTHKGKRGRGARGPGAGAVDMSRTARQVFWLEGGDDHGEKVRNAAVGMPNKGRGRVHLSGLNRGPSAPHLLGAGLQGYYSPVKSRTRLN
mmetsp:Transcript_8187/g.15670  ORF Transcript_8187/g.15670 Transcript_8187/m.15670 type:complete len:744 (-) Transcript_8187:210-2441(-)